MTTPDLGENDYYNEGPGDARGNQKVWSAIDVTPSSTPGWPAIYGRKESPRMIHRSTGNHRARRWWCASAWIITAEERINAGVRPPSNRIVRATSKQALRKPRHSYENRWRCLPVRSTAGNYWALPCLLLSFFFFCTYLCRCAISGDRRVLQALCVLPASCDSMCLCFNSITWLSILHLNITHWSLWVQLHPHNRL